MSYSKLGLFDESDGASYRLLNDWDGQFLISLVDCEREEAYRDAGQILDLLNKHGYIATVRVEDNATIIVDYALDNHIDDWGGQNPYWITPEEYEGVVANREGQAFGLMEKLVENASDSCDLYPSPKDGESVERVEDLMAEEQEQPWDMSWEKSKKPAELQPHYNWDCWDCDRCYYRFSCERSDHLEAMPKYKTEPANRFSHNNAIDDLQEEMDG